MSDLDLKTLRYVRGLFDACSATEALARLDDALACRDSPAWARGSRVWFWQRRPNSVQTFRQFGTIEDLDEDKARIKTDAGLVVMRPRRNLHLEQEGA